jgi:TonB family protein
MRLWSISAIIALIFMFALGGAHSETIETVKVGGQEVSMDEAIPDAMPPELIYQATPTYPIRARQLGDTGTVWLRICVGVEGDVVDVILTKPSGSRSLDRAALRTAYKNEFEPAIQDGQPIMFWLRYSVKFEITDKRKFSAGESVDVGIDSVKYKSVSGEFIPAEVEPKMIHQALPKYPPEAKEDGITGKVRVSVLVDEQGEVHEAKVAESSGSSLLDEAALEVADDNKYKPGIQSGLPVKVWVTYPVEFTLVDVDRPSSDGEIEVKSDSDDSLPTPDEFTSAQIMPEVIQQVSPEYPLQAKQDSVTGTVLVTALVDEEGKVLKANVAESSGTVSLDEAAIEAAYEFKYKPAIQDGHPVKVWVTYPVEFTLADEGKPSAGDSIEVKLDPEDYLPAPDEFILVDIRPELINGYNPDYPKLAEQAGITGVVWVKVLVDEEGKVLKAIVDKSSGTVSLDEAALEAAYKCRYKPGIQDGHPVKVWVTYDVEFKPDD